MRLMLAIAEAYPFAKTGGLGDVGAALPKALARRGHEVRLVLPGYPSLATGRPAEVLPLRVGRRHEHVALHHNGLHDGVDVWSVHHARHFSAASPYVGSLYEADVDPFVVFSVAAAELARRWRPDVVHVHDWHPALAPQLMRARARRHELDGCAAVLTIHNLAYQGRRAIRTAGSRAAARGSLLAQGIAHVDELNTVSASYRDEILTPTHGEGLDGLLRRRRDRLRAIRNGVDYDHFDPARDRHLDPRYDAATIERKQEHKLALQRRHGLEIDAGAPLFGMVARLVRAEGPRPAVRRPAAHPRRRARRCSSPASASIATSRPSCAPRVAGRAGSSTWRTRASRWRGASTRRRTSSCARRASSRSASPR